MDVKQNDPFGFMPLWCGLLDIYDDFAKICKKYGLRHYVAYGTAIGAIRHQGFIPWDDDFDVVMPREDYELFISKYYEELMQEHKLINHHNHKLFKNAFSKIMLGDRKKLTEIETATRRKQNQGVFIDIFPLDGYSPSLLTREFIWCKYMFYRVLDWFVNKRLLFPQYRTIKCIFGFFAYCLVPWVNSSHKIAVRMDKIAKTVPYKTSSLVGYVVNPTFYRQKIHTREEFGEGREMPFMNTIVIVPDDIDRYLKIEYGDYMRLPPEEKCVPHHVDGSVAPWRFGEGEL